MPASAALAVLVLFASSDGGYPSTVWYPGALLLIALLVATVIAYPLLVTGAAGEVLASVALFAAFTGWTYLTISWADVKGDAWDGANRTLLYLVIFALFALLPWRTKSAAVALGGYSLAIAALGAVTLLRAASADDPSAFFVGARFAEPVGYSNANSALFLVAFWPALFLSMRRETPLALRGVFLGAAGLMLEVALLPQSRGSLFAFPLVALVYLLLVPGRLRSGIALVSVSVTTALAHEPLIRLYSVAESARAGEALADARRAVILSVAALAVAGTLVAVADHFLRLSARTSRQISQVAGATALIAAIATAAVLVSHFGSPITRAERAWSQFKAGQPATLGATRFTGGVGTNRYDFWRVGVNQFRAAPLRGAGADNFAPAYLRDRRSAEEPAYPHSLEIQVLSQTGFVGAALFVGALAFALTGAWRARGARRSFGRALTGVSVTAFGYWLVHGSVDWFWEIPVLGGSAFAFLGLAAGMSRAPYAAESGGRRRAAVLAAGTAVVALVAATSLVLPWLAARDVSQAAASWRADAQRAFDRLDRARTLNVLSDRPDLVAGAIAMRVGDLERARAAFSCALERNPHNWYAHLELAVVESLEERPAAALARLKEAQELNPREPAIGMVRESVEAGEPVSPRALQRLFLERLESRTT